MRVLWAPVEGIVTVTVRPPSLRGRAATVPPWISATDATIVRPSPKPSWDARSLSRWNGWKIRSASVYSHCMHSHGVPRFPDPNSSGDIPKDKVIPLMGSPQFRVGQSACQHLFSGPEETAQQRRTRLADALAFARCMRARGVPELPGPHQPGPADPADGHRSGHRPAPARTAPGGPGLRVCDPRPAHPGGDRTGRKWRLTVPPVLATRAYALSLPATSRVVDGAAASHRGNSFRTPRRGGADACHRPKREVSSSALGSVWDLRACRVVFVRKAKIEDVEDMAVVMAAVAEEGLIATEPPVDLEARAQRFRELIEGPEPAASWVLVDDAGRIVGNAGAHERSAGVLYLGMAILPEARGQGGGRALLEAILGHAQACGAHKVELEVWIDNARAIALYASAGFEVEGLRRDHYRRRDGRLRSALLMARLLHRDQPG